jgi:hypothetical protein
VGEKRPASRPSLPLGGESHDVVEEAAGILGVMVVIVRCSEATKQLRGTPHDDHVRVCPVRADGTIDRN